MQYVKDSYVLNIAHINWFFWLLEVATDGKKSWCLSIYVQRKSFRILSVMLLSTMIIALEDSTTLAKRMVSFPIPARTSYRIVEPGAR